MNKKDLIDDVCHKTKLTKKEIDMALTSILDVIVTKVSQGEVVRLIGFGSFYTSEKKSLLEDTKDSKTSQKVVVKFSPGKFFKQKVNIRN